ncbi:Acetoin dehydrogenase E1 component alpha-subunit [Enhygromyxa salina]|uniref:2-oxoisovalerate dehydrogenase subunit alpha n=1 Tax=Enhygromyxa salina TaxID=215803 RepID=A0A0C1ZCL4_9BACT|nr:thiamine pyrophosphate-dependent enzyme [Enhygromyxa salina]KIG15444.1 Acetoin dehydrogenase E1 component alpha-subunit [Enhygromyxa salina]
MQATPWEPEGVESLLDSNGALVDPSAISGIDLRGYYKKLVAARVLDVKLRRLELPMWASAAGEEAVSVAIGDTLGADDWVFVGNRDAAIGLVRGVPLSELAAELLRLPSAPSRGRTLPGSISSAAHKIMGASEALGLSLGLAAGHAHGHALFGRGRATVVVFGEGLTTTGMFHESISMAMAHDTPLVFVCKSQIWPEGAPPEAGLLGDSVAERARAAGMWSRRCDGADPLGVRRSIAAAVHRAHEGAGPSLVEVVVTPITRDPPAERDPIERMRRLLDGRGEWTQTFQDVTEAEINGQLDRAFDEAVDGGRA